MPRPTTALIDVGAMRANLQLARRHAPESRAWAVVKANAYGHGLANALRGFELADGMALVEFDAAVGLREMGWKKRILLLEGAFESDDVALAQRHGFDLVVHHDEQVRMIEHAASAQPLHLHVKVNTGMNRLGFRLDEVADAVQRLQDSGRAASITLLTHLANADVLNAPAPLPAAVQLQGLHRLHERMRTENGSDLELSFANSAAALWVAGPHHDWIRPGIMLYGASPGEGNGEDFGLRPVMTLRSRLIAVQDVARGGLVGYGSRYVAPEDMRIGVVACGYADAYPRSAPDGTPVLVDGVRVPLAGRVSMDMMTVDLRAAPEAKVGSEVTLWGRGLAIDEVARAAGTIPYELTCALNARVALQVIDQG